MQLIINGLKHVTKGSISKIKNGFLVVSGVFGVRSLHTHVLDLMVNPWSKPYSTNNSDFLRRAILKVFIMESVRDEKIRILKSNGMASSILDATNLTRM